MYAMPQLNSAIQHVELLPPGPHAFYEFEHGIVGAWFDGSWWGLSLCRFLLNWSFRRTAMQLPYEPA